MARSGDGIVVEGVHEFEATATGLQAAVTHLDVPARAAGEAALAAATPHVPVKSGALRSSGRVVSGAGATEVLWDTVYAGVIYGGWPARNIVAQPWVDDTETTQIVTDVFTEYVGAAVQKVRGI